MGVPVAWVADRCEALVARSAGAVVAISDTFTDRLAAWGVPRARIHVVPNWAAIDEMPTRPRDNEWARAHGVAGGPVLMYAGTLGLKHDPSVLLSLASAAPPGTHTVVVSQGLGREWLETKRQDAPGLILLDYQPYEQLPDMLASADVLIVVLERDASRYSVPSKVLNYLCAGRPILGLLPSNNAVAQTIRSAGAGLVVEPGDLDATSAALNSILADSVVSEDMGRAARQYAERTFDVRSVADQFEAVLNDVLVYSGWQSRGGS